MFGSVVLNIDDEEFEGEMSLSHAHELSHIVEQNIRGGIDREVMDVIIHIEPYGDETREEKIGITKDVLD